MKAHNVSNFMADNKSLQHTQNLTIEMYKIICGINMNVFCVPIGGNSTQEGI